MRSHHGFKVGHRLVVTKDRAKPYHSRGFRASRTHKKLGFCVGGDGRHVHVLMGGTDEEMQECGELRSAWYPSEIDHCRS